MIQKLIIFLSLLVPASQAHSQFLRADHKKAEAMYHRPLAVVLFDLNECESQCDSIHMAWYNEKIREVLPASWELNDSIIFMESRMARSVILSKDNDYVMLTAGISSEGQQSSGEIFWYSSFSFMLFLSEDGRHLSGDRVDRSSPLIPDHEFSGHLLRGRYIFKFSFAEISISENDLAFAISVINNKVELALEKGYPKKGLYADRVGKEDTHSLKDMVLLIPEELDGAGVTAKKVNAFYDFPFRIASGHEIEKAIRMKEQNTAYLHYLWSDRARMFLGMVVDTESNKVLAEFKPMAVSLDGQDCLPAGTSYRTTLRMKLKKLKALNRMIK